MIYEPMAFGQSLKTGTATRNSQFGFQPPFRQTDNTNTNSFPQVSPFPPFGSTGCSQFDGTLTRNSQFFSQPPSRQTDDTRTNSLPQVLSFPPFGTPYTPAYGRGPAPSQTSPFGSIFQQAQPPYGTNTLGLTAPFGAPCQPAFGLQLPLLVVPQAPMFFVSQQPQYMHQQFPQQMVPQSALPLGLQQIRCSVVLDFGYQVPQNLEPQVPPVRSGQNTSPFGAPIASVAQSPFSNQSSVGETTKAPAGRSGFSQPAFGPRHGGTRVETYVSTPTEVSGNLQSISAMFTYGDKSHEELRWEDYQHRDKDCAGGHKLPASVPVNPSHSASHTFLPENTIFGTPGLDPSSSFSCTAFNNGSSTYYPRFQPAFSSLPFGESSTPAISASSSTFGTSTVGSSSTFDHAIPSSSCQSVGPGFRCSNVTSTSPFGHSLFYGTSTPALISSPSGFVSGSPSFGCSTVTSTAPFGHSLFYGTATPALISSPSSFVSGSPSFGCSVTSSTLPFGHSLSYGTTTAAPISSPSGFVSGRGPTLAFSSSQASGTSSSSGLSQASTAPIGQTTSLFGSTSSAFGFSQTHVNTESGHLQFAYSPIRQEPSLFGGSAPPSPSSGSSVLHSSTVESSSGFGSPLTFGSGNTQSTGISQFSSPSVGQRPSQSGPNDSEFTFPSCISDPFRALRVSGQQSSQSGSQPAAPAQTPAAFHNLFGCTPSGCDELIKNDPYVEWFATGEERS